MWNQRLLKFEILTKNARSFEHSLTTLQEELEAESTNELEWQGESQIDEDSGCETREP